MNDKQRRRFERLLRGSDFGAAHAESFPADNKSGKALANLKTIITEIENLDASRNTGASYARQGTSIKGETRAFLHEQLAIIKRTAKVIGLDLPEVKNKFRLPSGNINDQTLLSIARSFHAEATPLKDKFIEYDLPVDFLDALNRGISDFEKAINQQNTGAGARTSALHAIEAALERGETEMERLDAAVRNKFRTDPATLAAWESAKRLERAPRSKNATSPAPPAPKP